MKRYFDIVFSSLLIVIMALPMVIITVWIKLFSDASVIYWSNRVGLYGEVFAMPKFRTMKRHTPELASDQLTAPEQYFITGGGFLRRTSLDELPQLFSVLFGYMSLVGPRPVLTSQKDLIAKRNLMGVDTMRPGMTGWAQINGRDTLDDSKKLAYDVEYTNQASFSFDMKIIWSTVIYVLKRRDVSH